MQRDAPSHSRAQARAAKAPIVIDVEENERAPAEEESLQGWFVCPENVYHRVVPYQAIVERSDTEYIRWRTPPVELLHTHTMAESLHRWIREVSEDDLTKIIDTTPRGLTADPHSGVSYDFTPWQRISMAFYVTPFFPCTSRVEIDTPTLRRMALYGEGEMARRVPISEELSLVAGTMRDIGIVDLPTAAGKTAWVLSVALMLLSTRHFDSLCEEYVQKMRGTMFKGPMTPKIARLAIVATAGTTFDHFTTTLARLIPVWSETDPAVTVVVWTAVGKAHTVSRALQMPASTVVVWVIPPSKLNDVLRECTDVTVPLCIIDEYTQDTPRQRTAVNQSPVMKQIITQATPQALQAACCGHTNILKEAFGGFLHEPRIIDRLVRRRNFKEATQAVQQLCKLDLMTLTPFRTLVREDLRPLVPNGLDVTFVPSRRSTIVSHILDLETDLVPASLTRVLLHYLRPYPLDEASRTMIEQTVTDNQTSPQEIVTVLDRVQSIDHRADRAVVDRLKERILEFTTSCPICMEAQSGIHIMGCCGYCLCDTCFHLSGTSRCAFCRTDLVQAGNVVTPDAGDEGDEYPEAPPVAGEEDEAFVPRQMRSNTQITNLTLTLHRARAVGCKRLLLVVERQALGVDEDRFINANLLSSRTGIAITRVDDIIRGKGARFAKVKADFDSPNPAPMCLMCYGIDERFLVGTDLAHADGIIAVGSISHKILTQALGRVFRPRRDRDNTVPMRLWKVYTTTRVRAR